MMITQTVGIVDVFPNPFNPECTVKFTVRRRGKVTGKLYDVRGRLVRELFSKEYVPGTYSFRWNSSVEPSYSIASGIYFVAISDGKARDVRKVALIK